jgi:hypothetical protein
VFFHQALECIETHDRFIKRFPIGWVGCFRDVIDLSRFPIGRLGYFRPRSREEEEAMSAILSKSDMEKIFLRKAIAGNLGMKYQNKDNGLNDRMSVHPKKVSFLYIYVWLYEVFPGTWATSGRGRLTWTFRLACIACRFLQSEFVENWEISENYDSFLQKEIVENIEFHEKYDFVKRKEKVENREKVEI